jgi:hypothetical protein
VGCAQTVAPWPDKYLANPLGVWDKYFKGIPNISTGCCHRTPFPIESVKRPFAFHPDGRAQRAPAQIHRDPARAGSDIHLKTGIRSLQIFNFAVLPLAAGNHVSFTPKREKEDTMERVKVNYETLIQITKAISTIRDPEEIVLITVEGVTHALNVKGCALFLFSQGSIELKLAGSYGLSQEYLNKGPINTLRSIPAALQDLEPVAIFDVGDDPRIQYPEAAQKEGIASILSVPIIMGSGLFGCMRVYTAVPWEFTLNDVNFVQAVAQVVGLSIEMCRLNKGLKESIDILKAMRDPKAVSYKKRTPYEGVPKGFTQKEIVEANA